MPLVGEPVPLPTDPDAAHYGIRTEALRVVDPTTRAAWWRAAFDHCFAAIGAKRCTRPIVSIADSWLISLIARMGDAEALGWTRGFKPVAGQDAWINDELSRIREDLTLLEEGRRIPIYVDSTPTVDEASPRLARSEVSADESIKLQAFGYGCGCAYARRWF